MKEYIFPDENRAIRQYIGAEVPLNIDDKCRLEFEYCPETSLLYIRNKSFYSNKLSHFDSVDALAQRLTLPPVGTIIAQTCCIPSKLKMSFCMDQFGFTVQRVY